jgi:hypothetical protein
MHTHWLFKISSVLIVLMLALAFLPVVPASAAGTHTSIKTGDWTDPTTWDVGTVPDAASDSVVIDTGDTVTLTMNTYVGGSLTINSGGTLSTSGDNYALIFMGDFISDGTLSAGSSDIEIAGTGPQSIAGFATTGTVNMTKNGPPGCIATLTGPVSAGGLTMNGGLNAFLNLGSGLTHTFNGTWTRSGGALDVGTSTVNFLGPVSGTGGTFVATSGTVNYGFAGAQTVVPTTYKNLTLSGSGGKTTTGSTVTGILTFEGDATIAGTAPAYGAAATLKYNTINDRFTATEWVTPFIATGGIVITNIGKITLSAAKVLDPSVPLTIDAGATLALGNYGLTLGDDLTNAGTLSANSSSSIRFRGDFFNTGTVSINNAPVYLEGTTAQSIAGFSTGGTVFMNKTSGTATLTGDMGASTLTIDGAGGTLNLGVGRLHMVTGNVNMTSGTLEGGSSVLSLRGRVMGTGATFSAGTGTIDYNNTYNQEVAGLTYYNLSISGTPGGAKTLMGNTLIHGDLTIASGNNLYVGANDITVEGATTVNGTLTHDNINGTKIYGGLVTVNNSWTNPGGASIHFRGGLTHNGGTFNAGNGTYTFETNAQAIGGTSAITIPNLTVAVIILTNNGTLTVGTSLGGDGTLTQGVNSSLNISGTVAPTMSLVASASGNTVNYNGATAQSVAGIDYWHLTTSTVGTAINKTLTGNTTIHGDLTIGTNTIFLVGANDITVEGATTVNGTLTHDSALGTKVYTGLVTISSSRFWINSGNADIHFRGGLTFNGNTFTAGSGTYTFETNDQTIAGTSPSPFIISKVTITGINLTNTGTLTVGTVLNGTGKLTQGDNASLNIGGTIPLATLDATASGNTVNYNGGAQTVKVTTYYHLSLGTNGIKTITDISTVNGNLSLSGSASATTETALTIGGNLSLGSGSTLTVAGFNFSVGGTTADTGTLFFSSSTGTKVFTGKVTINGGHIWDNTGNADITFRGGLRHDGSTFNAGLGTYTFDTNAQVIEGNTAIVIRNIDVNGVTLTNNANLTVLNSLDGSGAIVQGTNATLNITMAAVDLPTLTATAAGNTVNYNYAAGPQTVKDTVYYNLTLSGGDVKDITGVDTINGNFTLTFQTGALLSAIATSDITVGGNLTINSNSTLDVSASNHDLFVGGNWVCNGTFTYRTATVTMNGSVARTLGGSNALFYDLIIDKAGGVTLTGNATVYHVLALTNGNITTATSTLYIQKDASITGAGTPSHVIGNVRKFFNNVTAGSLPDFSFPVGDASHYTPVDLAGMTGTSNNGYITVSTNTGEHPNISSITGFNKDKDVNRYWTLASSGITFTNYNATFNFVPADIDAGADPNNFVAKRFTSSVWYGTTTGTRTATSTQVTGETTMGGSSAFVVGEQDTTVPSVTGVSSTTTDGAYNAGDTIIVTVTFSEPVTVTGTPTLTLETGATDRTISYTGGTGSAVLTFSYTVQAGDNSPDLDYVSTSSLALGGGTIKDAGNNNASLTLPAPGAAGSLAANKNLVIDTTAPDTNITDQPANPTNDNTPTFAFSGNDGTGSGIASLMCKIDGGGYSACTSPYTAPALLDGSHTFYVYAIDNAGNVDATPAAYTWMVDTTSPTTSLSSEPASYSNDSTPTFTFSGNDGSGSGVASFQCKVDGGSYAACTSPHTTAALADGSHTFYVYAVDAAGNVDATPATYAWSVDTVPPTTTITGQPTDPSTDTTPVFTFSGSDGSGSGLASFRCKVDGGSYATCTSPYTTASLGDGVHTFYIYAVDVAGNVDATPASYTWTVHTTYRIFLPLIIRGG